MQFKKPLQFLIAGVSLISLGIAGCNPQTDFDAGARESTATVQPQPDQAQAPPATSPTALPTATPTTAPTTSPPATEAPTRQPDVVYVPTPMRVVEEMLQLANVTNEDLVYDLGSGDGRIVIAAAQKRGARGIGIDIDPQRVREARENAQRAGVSDRVEFRQQDLFQTDFSDATVVTLYLLPRLNRQLRPRLLSQLKPGTRIVSHAFDMGDWKPEKVVQVDGRTVYYWVVPETIPANLRE